MATITTKCSFSYSNLLYLLILLSYPTQAVEWDIKPFIELKLDYSDNMLQEEDGEASSFVGQLNPGLSLIGMGSRSNYVLDYRYQSLHYSSTLEDIDYQQAAAHFDFALIENSLYYYFDGSLGQASRDIYRGSIGDNLSDPDNITDVYHMKSGILWQQRLKAKADMFLDASATYLEEEQELSTTHGWDVNFRSSSTYKVSAGFWDLTYVGSERTPEEEEHSLLQRGQVQLGLQALRHLAIFAVANREQNDIPTSIVADELNSGSVGAGLRWRPNLRTSLAVAYNVGVYEETPDFWSVDFSLTPNQRLTLMGSYGKRFYGNAYSFNLKYERRVLSTELSYKEDISSYSRVDSVVAGYCEPNDESGPCLPVLEKTETSVPTLSPSVTNDIYLNRQAQWKVKYEQRRHALTFGALFSERDYINRSEGQRDLSGFFNWFFFLGERSTLKLDSLYRRLNRSDKGEGILEGAPSEDANEWLVGLSFERKLSRTGTLELRVQHKDKEGDTNSSTYTENRIGLYYTLRSNK